MDTRPILRVEFDEGVDFKTKVKRNADLIAGVQTQFRDVGLRVVFTHRDREIEVDHEYPNAEAMETFYFKG